MCGDTFCKFESKCSDIDKKDVHFKFTLDDGEDNIDFTVNANDLFVPGTEFNDVEDSCYVAIFKNTGAINDGLATNTWYVGNIFMKEYYK